MLGDWLHALDAEDPVPKPETQPGASATGSAGSSAGPSANIRSSDDRTFTTTSGEVCCIATRTAVGRVTELRAGTKGQRQCGVPIAQQV